MWLCRQDFGELSCPELAEGVESQPNGSATWEQTQRHMRKPDLKNVQRLATINF